MRSDYLNRVPNSNPLTAAQHRVGVNDVPFKRPKGGCRDLVAETLSLRGTEAGRNFVDHGSCHSVMSTAAVADRLGINPEKAAEIEDTLLADGRLVLVPGSPVRAFLVSC